MARFDFGPSARGDEQAATITIRELFAAVAISSLAIGVNPEYSAQWAVEMADALLKQLNEESEGGL